MKRTFKTFIKNGRRFYDLSNERFGRLIAVHCTGKVKNAYRWYGKTQNIRAWAHELGINEATLAVRLRRWPVQEAMTTPVGGAFGLHLGRLLQTPQR